MKNKLQIKFKSVVFSSNILDDINREDELIKILINSIYKYSLTKEEREKLNENTVIELSKLAISRFVRNEYEKDYQGGEIGDLLLFHILEIFEEAVQVVNKMSLKTSGKMHYHGYDAIHFGIKEDIRVLYLGEAKFGKSFNKTLTEAISSIKGFQQDEKNQFEIKLALGNLSNDIPDKYRNEIKNYLDPRNQDLTNYSQTYAIFLGYELEEFLQLEKDYSGKMLLEKINEVYRENVLNYAQSIIKKIQSEELLANKRFIFFLLPFKNIKGAKKHFFRGIGINNEENLNL